MNTVTLGGFGRCMAGALFLLAGFGGAQAASLTRDRFDALWAGPYAGAEIGGASAKFDWTYVNANYFDTDSSTVTFTDFRQAAGSLIGGAFAGYNLQSGNWVYGLEASASGSNLTHEDASPGFPGTDNEISRLNWLAGVTGRIGYARDRWLVFARGGWAGADVGLTVYDHTSNESAEATTWANGWTVGAGLEYMLRGGVSLGLAYDYTALGISSEYLPCPNCGSGTQGPPVVDGNIGVQTVMARLALKLGG